MSIETEKLRALINLWRGVRFDESTGYESGIEYGVKKCADELEAIIAEQPAAQDPNHPEIPDSSSRPAEPAAVPDAHTKTASDKPYDKEKRTRKRVSFGGRDYVVDYAESGRGKWVTTIYHLVGAKYGKRYVKVWPKYGATTAPTLALMAHLGADERGRIALAAKESQ